MEQGCDGLIYTGNEHIIFVLSDFEGEDVYSNTLFRTWDGTGLSDDSEVQEADGETPGNPMRWVEEIFAHHLAHFQSFFEGGLVGTSCV